jgi:hypothetical protein
MEWDTDVDKMRRDGYQDVAAIITAMTDAEQPFLYETVQSIMADVNIRQIILCVEKGNTWLEKTLHSLFTDQRLVIMRMKMSELGDVRNRGLESVTMPWVAYCDGDDVWCAGKIQAQRAWAEMTNSDLVGCDHYLINEKGKIRLFAFARHVPLPSSWLVRTEIMKRYPFRDVIPGTQDGEWWVRTGDLVRKVRCPKVLLKYRMRADSMSSAVPSKRWKMRVVDLASWPILREIVLWLSWIVWLMSRQVGYQWNAEWGQTPSGKVNSWELENYRDVLGTQ